MDLDDIVGAAGDALPEGVGAGKQIIGGSGDDSITGTQGSDEIFADPVPVDDQGGDDEVWSLGGDDLVRAFGGDNRVHGGPGDDRLYTADGDDLVWGGTGSDELQGGRGVDLMWGGSADDEVRGGEDNDVLHGGLGDDRVIGGSGDDLLMGELGADALELVLLFVPVEAAFLDALDHDPALIEDALEQRIVLVTPATLLLALRTCAELWRHQQRDRNAGLIADRAGRLHDKFAGFVEDLAKVDEQLRRSLRALESAQLKLSSGPGNLLRQVGQLRELGARVTKSLPEGEGQA